MIHRGTYLKRVRKRKKEGENTIIRDKENENEKKL